MVDLDQSKVVQHLSPDEALLSHPGAGDDTEDQFESFLPAIVEQSAEFDAVQSVKSSGESEGISKRKSSASEKPKVSSEETSRLLVDGQDLQSITVRTYGSTF